jgi:rare lipoprotein A
MKSGSGSGAVVPLLRVAVAMLVMLALAACGTTRGPAPDRQRDAAPSRPPDLSSVPDAVPRSEPRSRYGNPSSYEVFGQTYHVMASADGYVERGVASWYGTKFHGRRTSSGEPYDMYVMTAAHTRLPLPTYVRVTNLENRRSVVVRVNDRGPFARNRIIDLSYAAAHRLGMVEQGTALVEVRALTPGEPDVRMASGNAPSPLPVVAADNTRGAGLYVQVGAFASRHNAEQLLARLNDHDLGSAGIQEGRGADRPVYRVRIGPLDSVDVADRTVRGLERIGLFDYHIVVD